jgi:predicted Zn-dependent protease
LETRSPSVTEGLSIYMKRISIAGVIALCLVGQGPSMGQQVPPANEKAIALTMVGVIDTNILSRLQGFLVENLSSPIRVKAVDLQEKTNSVAEMKTVLTSRLAPNDVCLIALVNIPKEMNFREITFSSNDVAILNVWVLQKDSRGQPVDSEAYGRRVEKESMRLIGALLGLPTCVIPQCAMSLPQNDAELDAKGRNFCPPCRDKVQDALKSSGVASLWDRRTAESTPVQPAK